MRTFPVNYIICASMPTVVCLQQHVSCTQCSHKPIRTEKSLLIPIRWLQLNSLPALPAWIIFTPRKCSLWLECQSHLVAQQSDCTWNDQISVAGVPRPKYFKLANGNDSVLSIESSFSFLLFCLSKCTYIRFITKFTAMTWQRRPRYWDIRALRPTRNIAFLRA